MNTIVELFKGFPSFIQDAFKNHLIIFIIFLAIFVLALVLTNKVATICRYIFVIGAIACGVYAFLLKKNELLFALILSLIAMLVVRLLIYGFRNARQNRINKRIEERALAKAASRRGSWKNRQGYSGQQRVIEDDYVPEKMSSSEINDVIKNDMSDTPQAIKAKSATQQLPTTEELEAAKAALAKERAAKAKEAETKKTASSVSQNTTSLDPAIQAQIKAQALAAAKKLLSEDPSLAKEYLKNSSSDEKKSEVKKTYTVDDDPNPGDNEDSSSLSTKEKINNLIHAALGNDEDEEEFFNDEENNEKDLF